MYYERENPHGGVEARSELLDFSVNVNPLGTPRRVREAAEAALRLADRYPDPCCRELTRAIAAREEVPECFVLCGAGASELLYAWCAAVRPGRAVIPVPAFSEYGAALAAFGCTPDFFPLRRERDFLPGRELCGYLEQTAPEAVFLCDPNNPTGRRCPPEVTERLLSVCREKGIRLFADECFLALAGEEPGLKARLGEIPGLFVLKAFTKTCGMAGLRLGYGLSADGALLARMSALTPPWTVSGPAQAAGLAALEEEAFLAQSRALIREERPRLKAALETLGFRVCPSEANFLLFQGKAGLCAPLREEGIALRDAGNFTGLGPGWYRTAVRTRPENEALIAALRRIGGKEEPWQKIS